MFGAVWQEQGGVASAVASRLDLRPVAMAKGEKGVYSRLLEVPVATQTDGKGGSEGTGYGAYHLNDRGPAAAHQPKTSVILPSALRLASTASSFIPKLFFHLSLYHSHSLSNPNLPAFPEPILRLQCNSHEVKRICWLLRPVWGQTGTS